MRLQSMIICVACAVCTFGAGATTAQTYNTYGVPGTIQMPNGLSAPDGELSFTVSSDAETLRTTLGFQITPRLFGAFRYSNIDQWDAAPNAPYDGETFDRSFDLKYQVLTEGTYRPAVAVGLQDFIGTGLYSGEYIAATKAIGSVTGTVGLGWGRLGSYKPVASFGNRGAGFTGTGGQVEAAKWFRGDVAPFASVEWAATDRWTLKAEYSSDANTAETTRGHFNRTSPFNFGVDYRFGKRGQLSAYSVHGSDYGVMVSFATNPQSSPAGVSADGASLPVLVRSAGAAADLGWVPGKDTLAQNLSNGLTPAFDQLGLRLDGVELSSTRATVRIENNRYGANAQAVGRTARIMAAALPASVETFDIVLMQRGLPLSRSVVNRTALEALEFAPNASDAILATTRFVDAAGTDRATGRPADASTFTWAFKPYVAAALFDPSSPLRIDAGLELDVEWNPVPGLYFNGLARQRLVGNLSSSDRFSDSILPHVRSDGNFYAKATGPVVQRLTAAYFFRPGNDLYGRVTAGYLERQYGGVSAEILWKPVNSRFALGAEVNYAKQRSWEGLGFSPNTVVSTNPVTDAGFVAGPREYSAVTGHVSAYYAFSNDFHMQLDVGRYLAGDWGATLRLDREFNNGWTVGAYATITDVPFDDFGEGSFDKGIILTIPLDWQIGQPSRRQATAVIQPLLRDGGARLDVQDRLYDMVRDADGVQLTDRWARFWR
ncbi:MAG: YjbH domain-containing protein [Planktomarina sp.]